MKPLFTKGKTLRQPKVRVKKIPFFTFCPNEGEHFFYVKLNPDSYFVTHLEGSYIFFNLNFDLPIPTGLWEVVRIPFHEKYRWSGLVTWWERVMANYKYAYQIS